MTDQGCILGQLVSPPLEAGNNRRGPKRSLMSNSKRLLMTIRFLQNFPNILVTCSLFSARFSLKWHLPRKAFLIPLLKMEPPSTLYFIFSLSNYFSCISPLLTPPPSPPTFPFLSYLSPLECKAGYFVFCAATPSAKSSARHIVLLSK